MIKKSRFFICLCIMLIASVIFAGCGVSQASQSSSSSAAPSTTVTSSSSVASKITLADGIYTAKFTTDSSMFHVNEANNSMGTLTVKNGQATIHVSLASKGIVNLFAGLAEDAKKEGANILEPTNDEIKYSDGTTDTVFGFDIPVSVIDEEFDVALIGAKGKWYDHKVKVSEVKAAN